MKKKGQNILISRYLAKGNYSLSFPQHEEAWEYPRHTHQGHGEIILVTRGPLGQIINGRRVSSPAGELILIRDKDIHEISSPASSFYNLMFSNIMLEHLEILCGYPDLQKLLLAPRTSPVASLSAEKWEPLAEEMNKAFLTTDTAPRLLSLARIFSEVILGHFAPLALNPRQTDTRPGWLIKTLNHVEKNPEQSFSVTDLVALAGVSHEHLSRTFKKNLHLTPSGYLAKHRLQWAARLLSCSNRKVLDICYQVGFENLSYFCNLFRKEYNLTPREFRRRHSIRQTDTQASTVS